MTQTASAITKTRSARLIAVCAVTTLAAGCGNQMMRQPSFRPLESPRAAPPPEAVPVNAALTPEEAKPVTAKANGNSELASVLKDRGIADATGPAFEPPLPPPNLSDNARNEPTPPQVNALRTPLPDDPRVVRAGHTLFVNRCVQCHNAGGYGVGPVGRYLVPAPPDLASELVQKCSDGAIFWHITMGQGKMPAFRTWTTPAERWALTAYVRSLRKAAPGARSDDTAGTPYPVYGKQGFEEGRSDGH